VESNEAVRETMRRCFASARLKPADGLSLAAVLSVCAVLLTGSAGGSGEAAGEARGRHAATGSSRYGAEHVVQLRSAVVDIAAAESRRVGLAGAGVQLSPRYDSFRTVPACTQ
jgi:hypothetical protein